MRIFTGATKEVVPFSHKQGGQGVHCGHLAIGLCGVRVNQPGEEVMSIALAAHRERENRHVY